MNRHTEERSRAEKYREMGQAGCGWGWGWRTVYGKSVETGTMCVNFYNEKHE